MTGEILHFKLAAAEGVEHEEVDFPLGGDRVGNPLVTAHPQSGVLKFGGQVVEIGDLTAQPHRRTTGQGFQVFDAREVRFEEIKRPLRHQLFQGKIRLASEKFRQRVRPGDERDVGIFRHFRPWQFQLPRDGVGGVEVGTFEIECGKEEGFKFGPADADGSGFDLLPAFLRQKTPQHSPVAEQGIERFRDELTVSGTVLTILPEPGGNGAVGGPMISEEFFEHLPGRISGGLQLRLEFARIEIVLHSGKFSHCFNIISYNNPFFEKITVHSLFLHKKICIPRQRRLSCQPNWTLEHIFLRR